MWAKLKVREMAAVGERKVTEMSAERVELESIDIEQPIWAKYLFDSPASAWLWLLVRVWVGWAWLEAGLHKVTDPTWMVTGQAIVSFWQRAVAVPPPPARPVIAYDWYRMFLQFLMENQTHVWMARLIVIGEILVGVALIVGALVGISALFGAFMNINFMLAGTASTNPVLFLVSMLLILAWKSAGYYGLDRWILPALGTPWHLGWLLGGRPKRASAGASRPA